MMNLVAGQLSVSDDPASRARTVLPGGGQRFAVFLLASIVVHALLLAGVRWPGPGGAPFASSDPRITVQLVADEAQQAQAAIPALAPLPAQVEKPPAPAATPVSAPHAAQPAPPARQRVVAAFPVAPVAAARPAWVSQRSAAADPAPASMAAAERATPGARLPSADLGPLRAELHRRISANKQYPLRARRFGMEGVARLAFTLTPMGEIDALTVEHSSGHAVLDDEARAAVTRAAPLAAAQDYLHDEQRFRVNVVFALGQE